MKRMIIATCVATFLALVLTSGTSLPGARAEKNVNRIQPLDQTEQFVPGRVLVKFRTGIMPDHARNIIAALGARDAGEIPNIGVHILDLPFQASEKAFVQALQARAEVEFAELDRIVAPAAIAPNDPWYANWEWHLQKIQAPAAWSTTTGSSGITIAILDGGVDGTHEDLVARMVPGWNVYSNNADTSDCCGHGTAVAGTAAASSNNGIGVASVCWNCSIMPVRITDPSGYATYSSIASGVNWAANHGARVANISWTVSDSSTVRSAAQYFQSKGGVVVASAGNTGTFNNSSDNPYILTISATDRYDTIYSYSTTGNNIDLASPGDSTTTQKGGGYTTTGGTSFSAPIVAGVAALVLSVNPNLTPTQVQDILKQSADDLGTVGWDPSYGYGRVNASRAVSMAGGGASDTAPPAVSFAAPTAGASVSGSVSVQVAASDNIGVSSVSLSVDGLATGTDTVSPYTFQWDTTLVSNGAHTLSSTAIDAAGNTSSASITVTVSNLVVDSSPPSVVITSPANGSKASMNTSVYVNAWDNVGVAKVELYVDGSLASTSASAPFTTKWNSRKASTGTHNLQCKAYDAAGNANLSQIVGVVK